MLPHIIQEALSRKELGNHVWRKPCKINTLRARFHIGEVGRPLSSSRIVPVLCPAGLGEKRVQE